MINKKGKSLYLDICMSVHTIASKYIKDSKSWDYIRKYFPDFKKSDKEKTLNDEQIKAVCSMYSEYASITKSVAFKPEYYADAEEKLKKFEKDYIELKAYEACFKAYSISYPYKDKKLNDKKRFEAIKAVQLLGNYDFDWMLQRYIIDTDMAERILSKYFDGRFRRIEVVNEYKNLLKGA